MTALGRLLAARKRRLGPIGVVSQPIGRRACVLTAKGTVHRGYVPPPGYVLWLHEVLFEGIEISEDEADEREQASRK